MESKQQILFNERECKHCEKKYAPNREDQKYCSNTCRAKASQKRKKLAGLDESPAPKATSYEPREPKAASYQPRVASMQYNTPEALPPTAQFIIEQLKKETERWENAYKEEKEARKKAKAENAKLRDELAEIKTDNRIKAVEDAKPGGLAGLVDTPLFQQMLPHIGPSLGRLLEKFLDPAQAAAQIAGPDAQGNQAVSQIVGWYMHQPEPVQALFYEILNELAQLQGEALTERLNHIKNLITYDTTANANNNGTWN